jgi:hypothetical protein
MTGFANVLRNTFRPILAGSDPARALYDSRRMLIEHIFNTALAQDPSLLTLTPTAINRVLMTILPTNLEFVYYPPSEHGLTKNQWETYMLLQTLFSTDFSTQLGRDQQRYLIESIVTRFRDPARAAAFLRNHLVALSLTGPTYIRLKEGPKSGLSIYPVRTEGVRVTGVLAADPIFRFSENDSILSLEMKARGENIEPDLDHPQARNLQTAPAPSQMPEQPFRPVVNIGTITGSLNMSEPVPRFISRVAEREQDYLTFRYIYNRKTRISSVLDIRLQEHAAAIDPTKRVLTPGAVTRSLIIYGLLDRPYVHVPTSRSGLTAYQYATYLNVHSIFKTRFSEYSHISRRVLFNAIVEGFEFRAQALAFFWLLHANYPDLFDIRSNGSGIRIYYSADVKTLGDWLYEFTEEERDLSLEMIRTMPIDPASELRVHPPRGALPDNGRPWISVEPLRIVRGPGAPPSSYLTTVWPPKAWEEALLNGISSEPFQQASDADKATVLHYMRDQTSLPLSLFNELLYRIWPQSGLPVPQIQTDRTQLVYVQHWDGPYQLNPIALRSVYDPTFPRPSTVRVTPGLRFSGVQDMLDSLQVLIDEEAGAYAGDDRIVVPLRQLRDDMVLTMDQIWPTMGDMPTNDIGLALAEWRLRALEILKARKALGRRCRNAADPFTLEGADEIPENEFIRMRTGYCWNINSLLDYVQETTNGDNDASRLENYGSPHLWHDNDELQRVTDHEAARARDFQRWLESAMTERISQDTLDMMYVTAQVQISRGPAWAYLVERNLDPWYYQQFMKYTGGDFYRLPAVPELLIGGQNGRIATAPEVERYRAIGITGFVQSIMRDEAQSPQRRTEQQIRQEIADGDLKVAGFWEQHLPADVIPLRNNLHEMIRVQLKRVILNDFWAYYSKLSQTEKDALERARKGFYEQLNSCYQGTQCVYIWARILFQAVYKVAALKGLTHYQQFDTAEPGF